MGTGRDSLIVRWWDCATKYILKFSFLQHIISCQKEKYIRSFSALEEGEEEKEANKKKLSDTLDSLIILMFATAVIMSLGTYYFLKNELMSPVVQWPIIIIGSYRLVEIMIVQVRLWFFDISMQNEQNENSVNEPESAMKNLRDIRQSIFWLWINILEILFIFIYLIIATIFFDPHKQKYIEEIHFLDILKCSLYYLFNLKEIDIGILQRMSDNVWFEFLMIVEQLVRIFIVCVVVTKLVGLLPQKMTRQ